MWSKYLVILLALASASGAVTNHADSDEGYDRVKREFEVHIRNGSPQPMSTAVAIFVKWTDTEPAVLSCSGTILSDDRVITAAHCLEGIEVDKITVVAGAGDLKNYMMGEENIAKEFSVKKISVHPHYQHLPNEKVVWDLAIMELTTKMPLETNPRMQAAVLPPPGMKITGQEVQVGGWGKQNQYSGISLTHLVINIPINPDEECSNTFEPGEFLRAQMFCAGDGRSTTCRGDSGAGAILRGWKKPIIYGVLSFGTKTCKVPAVFQKIEKSLPWIFKVTKLG